MSMTIGSIRACLLAVCLLFVFGLSLPHATSDASDASGVAKADAKADEALILERIEKACVAFEKAEPKFLLEFLDETFTLTDTRGNVTNRDQNLDEVRKRDPRYDVFRNHTMKVRVYGDAAVVTGITTVKGTSGGQAFAADLQFTDTLIKRNGTWRMVSSHVSPAAKPK